MSMNRNKELQAELEKEKAELQLKFAKHVEQTREFLKKKEQAKKMMMEGQIKEARDSILQPLLKSLKANVNFAKQNQLTLEIKFEIGFSYYIDKDYKQAKAVFKDTLKLTEKLMGKKDKQSLYVKFFLASCFKELKQNKEALVMFMELFSVQKVILDKDDNMIKVTETSLANLLIKDEQYRRQGLQMLEVMLAKRIKEEGQDGLGAIKVKKFMAYAYQLSEDWNKCLALHKEILASQEKTLGKDHEDTKKTEKNIEILTSPIQIIKISDLIPGVVKTHIVFNDESRQEVMDYYSPFLKD